MTQPTPPGWYPDPSGAPGQRYFDGVNWTDQRAPAQQAAPAGQPLQKKKPVWPWILLAIFVVILLGFGACVAFVGRVANEVTKDSPVTIERPDGSSQSGGSGPDFPGKQPNDTSVDAGGAVTSEGVTTTSGPLSRKQQFGNTYLCTQVTIQNNSKEQAAFSALFDWKMQDPSGTTKDATVMGAATESFLGSGEVAPGGTAKGDVCFESPQGTPSGTYIVLFDPTFRFSSNRIGWINKL